MVALSGIEVVMSEWISVDDRLPDPRERVLIFIDYKSDTVSPSIHDSTYTGSTFRRGGATVNALPNNEGIGVTHWMPLPEPPKHATI